MDMAACTHNAITGETEARETKVPGHPGLQSEALPQKNRTLRVEKVSMLLNIKHHDDIIGEMSQLVKTTFIEFIKKERYHHFLMLKREEVLIQDHGSVNSHCHS